MRLEGKVALVTGSARGIGKGIAQRFAAEGARVGILDLDADACQAAVAEIEAAGGSALEVAADISDPAQVEAAAGKLADHFGAVTVLVNNAAVMPVGALHETSLADVDRCLAVNLRGTCLVCGAVVPGMIEAGGGSIIHIASVTGVIGLPRLAVYSMTKGALIALTRAMSTDYAAKGIRTNSVSPGTIDSPMLHDFVAWQRKRCADAASGWKSNWRTSPIPRRWTPCWRGSTPLAAAGRRHSQCGRAIGRCPHQPDVGELRTGAVAQDRGAWHLHRATEGRDLDPLLSLLQRVGVMGNPGQAIMPPPTPSWISSPPIAGRLVSPARPLPGAHGRRSGKPPNNGTVSSDAEPALGGRWFTPAARDPGPREAGAPGQHRVGGDVNGLVGVRGGCGEPSPIAGRPAVLRFRR